MTTHKLDPYHSPGVVPSQGRPRYGAEGGPCHTCGSADFPRGWELSFIGGIGVVAVWECADWFECWDRRDGKVV